MLALESLEAQGNSPKAEAAALIPENLKIDDDLTPFLPEIKLKIYPYRIIRNESADQSGAGATKTGL